MAHSDRKIYLIALTAHVRPEDAKKCLEARMSDFLANIPYLRAKNIFIEQPVLFGYVVK